MILNVKFMGATPVFEGVAHILNSSLDNVAEIVLLFYSSCLICVGITISVPILQPLQTPLWMLLLRQLYAIFSIILNPSVP